jgi:Ca-activated chloride channel homolog
MMCAHPIWFLALLLLPLAAWLKGRRGRPAAFVSSSVGLLSGLTRARRSHAGAILAALRWLALTLFIVALTEPRLMKSTTEVKASGIDIVCALDLSGSMKTQDYIINHQQISRIDMAEPVLKQFIEGRPNDRIGLVVFAVQAFIASPLTLDHDFLLETIDQIGIGAINSDATAIGDGITTALNRLREVKSKSKIIVLMTDGANNSGVISPITATQAAKALGVKIYTIGLGNREIVQQMGLPEGFLPDEDTLEQVAEMTGGKYYRADNAEKFKAIYAEIDKLEKSEAVINKYTEFKELFPWFVTGGLAVLLLEITLGQTLLRRLP